MTERQLQSVRQKLAEYIVVEHDRARRMKMGKLYNRVCNRLIDMQTPAIARAEGRQA